MNGRDKCELLNEIRQKIADENNIEFTIYDCTFEGDCKGTCPKCESELEYLERELEKKRNAGEKINLKNIFTLDENEHVRRIDNIEEVDELCNLDGMPAIVEEDEELFIEESRIGGLIKELRNEELRIRELHEELRNEESRIRELYDELIQKENRIMELKKKIEEEIVEGKIILPNDLDEDY